MLSAAIALALAAAPTQYVQVRFGQDAVAQLFAPGFDGLSPKDKALAWHLTLAAHEGEPIAYDQLGWRNLELKRLLEGTYLFGLEGTKDSRFDAQLTDFLRRFYGNTGNHDSATGQKFLPGFTSEQLGAAAHRALAAGAPFGVADAAALDRWLESLRPSLFDPAFEPQTTSKSPPPGQDMLTASSNTAYGKGVTLADLEKFHEAYPLNSRVVKKDGQLVEEVFRAGLPNKKVAPGLYAAELLKVNRSLDAAARLAGPKQREALYKLIRYFQTGNPADWDGYNIAWLRADPAVDANLGFIETYVDARGQKGQWEALVNFKDPSENRVMELMAKRAQYFEDRMPWPDVYKRKKVQPPVAKAVDFVTTYPEPPAGINLPNEQHIRQQYGSKSILVANVMETAAAVKRVPLALEFSRTDEGKELARKYSIPARKLLVGFHETIGHASGQVDPKLQGNPSTYLKEYDNTLEEARADLVALWHAFDPALADLSPDHEQIAQQMYRDFLVEGLTIMSRVQAGDTFEEDHQRGIHMTVSFLLEEGAAKRVDVAQPDGTSRTYYEVAEFPKMREAVGELLSKLMVIKATGDYAGIQELVTRYGVKFDPKLRDEVVSRVRAANVPVVVYLSSPRLAPVVDKGGNVVDVKLSADQDFVLQNLERSLLGQLDPKEATSVAAQGASLEQLRAEFKKLAPKTPPPAGLARAAP